MRASRKIAAVLLFLMTLLVPMAVLAYPSATIHNHTEYDLVVTVEYIACKSDTIKVPAAKFVKGQPVYQKVAASSYRGLCLIDKISGTLTGFGPDKKQPVSYKLSTSTVKSKSGKWVPGKLTVIDYISTGTSYTQFYVKPFGGRYRIFSEAEWKKVSDTKSEKSPGFRFVNKTPWPVHFSLDQVGCLYHDIIPAATFDETGKMRTPGIAKRKTGSVWFTLRIQAVPNPEPKSDWRCVKPVAEVIADVAMLGVTLVTGGVAGAARAGLKAGIKAATDAGFKAGAKGVAKAFFKGTAQGAVAQMAASKAALAAAKVSKTLSTELGKRLTAALLKKATYGSIFSVHTSIQNWLETLKPHQRDAYTKALAAQFYEELKRTSPNAQRYFGFKEISAPGQYAGYAWPFRCKTMPTYEITGGPEMGLTRDGDIRLIDKPLNVRKINTCGNNMMAGAPTELDTWEKNMIPGKSPNLTYGYLLNIDCFNAKVSSGHSRDRFTIQVWNNKRLVGERKSKIICGWDRDSSTYVPVANLQDAGLATDISIQAGQLHDSLAIDEMKISSFIGQRCRDISGNRLKCDDEDIRPIKQFGEDGKGVWCLNTYGSKAWEDVPPCNIRLKFNLSNGKAYNMETIEQRDQQFLKVRQILTQQNDIIGYKHKWLSNQFVTTRNVVFILLKNGVSFARELSKDRYNPETFHRKPQPCKRGERWWQRPSYGRDITLWIIDGCSPQELVFRKETLTGPKLIIDFADYKAGYFPTGNVPETNSWLVKDTFRSRVGWRLTPADISRTEDWSKIASRAFSRISPPGYPTDGVDGMNVQAVTLERSSGRNISRLIRIGSRDAKWTVECKKEDVWFWVSDVTIQAQAVVDKCENQWLNLSVSLIDNRKIKPFGLVRVDLLSGKLFQGKGELDGGKYKVVSVNRGLLTKPRDNLAKLRAKIVREQEAAKAQEKRKAAEEAKAILTRANKFKSDNFFSEFMVDPGNLSFLRLHSGRFIVIDRNPRIPGCPKAMTLYHAAGWKYRASVTKCDAWSIYSKDYGVDLWNRTLSFKKKKSDTIATAWRFSMSRPGAIWNTGQALSRTQNDIRKKIKSREWVTDKVIPSNVELVEFRNLALYKTSGKPGRCEEGDVWSIVDGGWKKIVDVLTVTHCDEWSIYSVRKSGNQRWQIDLYQKALFLGPRTSKQKWKTGSVSYRRK